MPINRQRIKNYLRQSDFESLFIEELGWDTVDSVLIPLTVDGKNYSVRAIAQKRSFIAYQCRPEEDDTIPDSTIRRKIDRQITLYTREHIIIYDALATQEQVWQWVDKDSKPAKSREYLCQSNQVGNLFLQKLDALAVSMEEEEKLALLSVKEKARKAFDVEKVTKQFYTRFKQEHEKFLEFIQGIQSQFDREWYASLMLNRLMFIYFIQKEGFLADIKNGDPVANQDYLRCRLKECQERRGQDEFHSFYRYFLLQLFHSGLGNSERSKELEELLGKVPYLNGGLFDVHQLEESNPDIQISDQAFEQIFDFFDGWDWHLDNRANKQGNEINPDVLGYIFEKYINQKQMGAYYTKEDITEYISKNTVIPFLFDASEKACAIAFRPDSFVWQLLKENPNRYIYEAVQTGVDIPLPDTIAAGIEDVSKRDGWNRPADNDYALPTETWREHVARRQRCLELRQKMIAGEVHSINDLITYNLDIRQFAQDVITNSEGPELLRAFYKALTQISILDPTCGSGAFLFAALNILEPLYEACLDRMKGFLDDLERSRQKVHPEKFSDFRKVLEQVDKHPNREYFILKSIILNNLYGVDIMEEAVEICKLRLFLKLVAQVEADLNQENYGLEPLPDIDFNIRAGNTLVGFANYEEVRQAVEGDEQTKLDLFSDMQRIDERAEIADRAFQKFRQQQTDLGGNITYQDKQNLRNRLNTLNQELNQYLAREYGVDTNKTEVFEKWLTSHQPFHWFVEFYGIMKQGGFNVIIGNPPYIELKELKKCEELKQYKTLNYNCERAGNLYALVLERCFALCSNTGQQGFIVPVSSVSTDRYENLQNLLIKYELYYSSFDDRPSRLFDGLEHIRLTIHLIGKKSKCPSLFSTRYNKWSSIERPTLFSSLKYASANNLLVECSLPKLSSQVEGSIIEKIFAQMKKLSYFYVRDDSYQIFYSRKVGYFLQVLNFEPRVFDGQGRKRSPSEFKSLNFSDEIYEKLALCCLNSNLFYWFITVFSDCRHVNKREIDSFPIDLRKLSERPELAQLLELAQELMRNLEKNSEERRMKFSHDTLTVQCIFPKQSKSIINEIDRVLAKHYGFTDEELDFIINYDIKYRMGRDAEEES
jgi:Eco57I restriction-modification methylase